MSSWLNSIYTISALHSRFQQELINVKKELKEQFHAEIAALKTENELNQDRLNQQISALKKKLELSTQSMENQTNENGWIEEIIEMNSKFEEENSTLKSELEQLRDEYEEFRWKVETDVLCTKDRCKRNSNNIYELQLKCIRLDHLKMDKCDIYHSIFYV